MGVRIPLPVLIKFKDMYKDLCKLQEIKLNHLKKISAKKELIEKCENQLMFYKNKINK